MRKTVAVVITIVGAAIFLSGCASGASTGVAVQTQEMKFLPKTATVNAGRRVITVINSGKLRHTFSLNSLGEEVTVAAGKTETLTLDLKPGTYRYVCRVLDHEGLGMRGTLKVRNS